MVIFYQVGDGKEIDFLCALDTLNWGGGGGGLVSSFDLDFDE